MYSLVHLRNILKFTLRHQNRCKSIGTASEDCLDVGENNTVYRPYIPRPNETIEELKARLIYQSRKRGILENDLLLSTFVAKYLGSMTKEQLHSYDRLINIPSNEWDLYYWATNAKPTPKEFESDVMTMFKKHVQNLDREARIKQPDLY